MGRGRCCSYGTASQDAGQELADGGGQTGVGGCTETLFAVTGSWLTAGSTAAELPRAGGCGTPQGQGTWGWGAQGTPQGREQLGKEQAKAFC